MIEEHVRANDSTPLIITGPTGMCAAPFTFRSQPLITALPVLFCGRFGQVLAHCFVGGSEKGHEPGRTGVCHPPLHRTLGQLCPPHSRPYPWYAALAFPRATDRWSRSTVLIDRLTLLTCRPTEESLQARRPGYTQRPGEAGPSLPAVAGQGGCRRCALIGLRVFTCKWIAPGG